MWDIREKKPFEALLKDTWVLGQKQNSIISGIKETEKPARFGGVSLTWWATALPSPSQAAIVRGSSTGSREAGNRTCPPGIGEPQFWGKNTVILFFPGNCSSYALSNLPPDPHPLLPFIDTNGSVTNLARFYRFTPTLIIGIVLSWYLAQLRWFFFLILFIYLFMAVLGLRFCARAFSSCGKRGPLFITVRGPLTIAASLAAEHRLQTCRLSNCGSWA